MATAPRPKLKKQFDVITGYLVVPKVADAVKFYKKVFGAEEAERHQDETGKVWHSQLEVQGVRLLVMETFKDMELVAPKPKPAQGDPSMLMIFVSDVDGTFKTAIRAGATPIVEPFDAFWGDRYAEFRDPFGHRWALNCPQKRLSAEQRIDRFDQWRRQHGNLKSPAPVVKFKPAKQSR